MKITPKQMLMQMTKPNVNPVMDNAVAAVVLAICELLANAVAAMKMNKAQRLLRSSFLMMR